MRQIELLNVYAKPDTRFLTQNMRICIDSSVIIPGLQGNNPAAVRLLEPVSSEVIR